MKSTLENGEVINRLQKTIKKPSRLRLYIMRGLYLLTFIGLAYDSWSTILYPNEQLDTLSGVAISFWASYSLLMGLGVRFPLKMLPLLFLQLLYKSSWIIGVYLPARSAGLLDLDLNEFFRICVIAIILDIIVIPWSYSFKIYLGDFFNLKRPVYAE